MIYASHLLEDREMQELYEKTEMGIESIEFSIAENLDHLNEKIRSYRERIQGMGFKHLSIHGAFLDLNPAAFDTRIRETTMYRFQQSYEAAVELGAERVIFHTGYVPRIYYLYMWPERVSEFFNEFMEGKSGLPVLLENVYDPQPDPIVRVKELTESEDFNLCLDIGHAHCYSEQPLTEWIEKTGKYVKHIHFHNNDKTWDHHRGVDGGTIPLPEVQQWMKKYISHATAAIECSDMQDILGWQRELSQWKMF